MSLGLETDPPIRMFTRYIGFAAAGPEAVVALPMVLGFWPFTAPARDVNITYVRAAFGLMCPETRMDEEMSVRGFSILSNKVLVCFEACGWLILLFLCRF